MLESCTGSYMHCNLLYCTKALFFKFVRDHYFMNSSLFESVQKHSDFQTHWPCLAYFFLWTKHLLSFILISSMLYSISSHVPKTFSPFCTFKRYSRENQRFCTEFLFLNDGKLQVSKTRPKLWNAPLNQLCSMCLCLLKKTPQKNKLNQSQAFSHLFSGKKKKILWLLKRWRDSS